MLFQNRKTVKTYECLAPLARRSGRDMERRCASTGTCRFRWYAGRISTRIADDCGVRKRRRAQRGNADRTGEAASASLPADRT